MKTGECKNRKAVTTVTQCRVPIFAPVKQMPSKTVKDVAIETTWGSVTFKNMRLTQVHRNILDCIFSFYERSRENADGSVTYLISIRQLQKKLGIIPRNHAWLVKKLDEIRETTLIFSSKKQGWNIHTGIIRKHKYSNLAIENSKRKLTGSKDGRRGNSANRKYGIVFESEYMQVFKDELNIHSEKLTEDIVSLKDAFLQAFVRFITSHMVANFAIDDVLQALGVMGGERQTRKLKAKLNTHAEILLANFGIRIENHHVFYHQNAKIWFQNPQQTELV